MLQADLIAAIRGYTAGLMMQHASLMVGESPDYHQLLTGEDPNTYEALKALYEG